MKKPKQKKRISHPKTALEELFSMVVKEGIENKNLRRQVREEYKKLLKGK